jgi:hypothetical protein
MQDQTKRRDVAREFDRAERDLLDLLLDADVPGPWSVHELGLALGDRVRAVDALAALERMGLVHRCQEFVFATRPAVRCMQLAEAH